MTAKVYEIRDYKRREEKAAIEERLAKRAAEADTAPCELPQVWPDFYHAPDKDPA